MYTELEIAGKNRQLKYSYNSLAELEDRTETGLPELLSQKRMGFSTIRLLLWGALKHDDKHLTIDRTGDLIETHLKQGGDIRVLVEACIKELHASGLLKDPESGDEKNA